MRTDNDIKQFISKIGAKELSLNSEPDAILKTIFNRSNYFRFNEKFMIVKISRSKKPFWGVGKKFIDLLNSQDDYYLVLLVAQGEGWVFTKREVNAHIKSERWKLREADNNFKINSPLPDSNSFFSPSNFLKKLGLLKK